MAELRVKPESAAVCSGSKMNLRLTMAKRPATAAMMRRLSHGESFQKALLRSGGEVSIAELTEHSLRCTCPRPKTGRIREVHSSLLPQSVEQRSQQELASSSRSSPPCR